MSVYILLLLLHKLLFQRNQNNSEVKTIQCHWFFGTVTVVHQRFAANDKMPTIVGTIVSKTISNNLIQDQQSQI